MGEVRLEVRVDEDLLRRTGMPRRDVERILERMGKILLKAKILSVTEEDAEWLERAVKEGLRERVREELGL